MNIYQERLKLAREELNLSQVAISNLLGMKPQQWQKYESGLSKMSLETLRNFCMTFNLSADWLLGIDREEQRQEKIAEQNKMTHMRNAVYRAGKALEKEGIADDERQKIIEQLQSLIDQLK